MTMRLRDVKSAHTFDQIASVYERCKPWPKVSHELGPTARPLGSHGKRYTTIRPIEAEGAHGFACRYHDADLVSWLRDDANGSEFCTVVPWESLSSETFTNALGPSNVRFHMDDRDEGTYYTVTHGPYAKRVYRFAGPQTFVRKMTDAIDAPYLPVEPKPYKFIDTRSPLVRLELRQAGLYDFHKWLTVVMTFDQSLTHYARDQLDPALRRAILDADAAMGKHGVLGLLADPNKWMHLRYASHYVTHDGNRNSVIARIEHIVGSLRKQILQRGSLPPVTYPSWVTPEAHESQRRARRVHRGL